MKLQSWSEEEIKFLENNYPDKGRKYCANSLNKTENQIKVAAKYLKLRVNFKKTSEEIRVELMKYNFTNHNGEFVCFKNCPECGEKIKFKAQGESYLLRNLKKSKIKNALCNTCCRLGEKNSFFGKRHTNESNLKISKSRIGKACGEENAMANPEYRKRVSDALKKKYASGDLDFLRKIQSDNAIKNQANGKIKAAPVSKAEIEIREYLKNKGIDIITQFNIGSLRYDFLIKDKNVLIEYNGDYWHCNPEKYDKDYFNQKKGMYAWKLWENDEKKKNIAESMEYKLFIIWEKDYNINKEEEINKILNKL